MQTLFRVSPSCIISEWQKSELRVVGTSESVVSRSLPAAMPGLTGLLSRMPPAGTEFPPLAFWAVTAIVPKPLNTAAVRRLHYRSIHQKEVTMVPILSLWVPILVSAVFVFIASSLVHMVFGYHANDLKKLPDEDATTEALRKLNIPAGQYIIPHAASMKAMNSPEYQEKVKKGPGAILTIWPGGNVSMTANLTQWFIYSVVVGIFAAYVAGRALEVGAHYLAVFRFVGVTAFACYAIGGWSESIWWKRSWSTTFKNTLDGLIYALVTAGTFGWLWPR
jgi:hypothetical protein